MKKILFDVCEVIDIDALEKLKDVTINYYDLNTELASAEALKNQGIRQVAFMDDIYEGDIRIDVAAFQKEEIKVLSFDPITGYKEEVINRDLKGLYNCLNVRNGRGYSS